jgi:hypothetical protein
MQVIVSLVNQWVFLFFWPQFNRKPAKGIEFLLAEKLLPPEPQAIAQFLHDTPGLNKVSVDPIILCML